MKQVEYINPRPYEVIIVGPDKVERKIPKYSKVILSEWFMKYTPKPLRVVRILNESDQTNSLSIEDKKKKKELLKKRVKYNKSPSKRKVAGLKPTANRGVVRAQKRNKRSRKKVVRPPNVGKNPIVGRQYPGDPTGLYKDSIQNTTIPISNGIGVGILSYNRLNSIKRLIESIRKNTDLSRTTIFVSDESDDKKVKKWLRNQNDIILIDNDKRLGIAGQSNRLLKCLERFRHKLILNDDVEVLRDGWDRFYFESMQKTGYHHFCYRQVGIYGAKATEGSKSNVNGLWVHTIHDKPHGAVMAISDKAFKTVGYFDEKFGIYGMEHVDYSNRIGVSGLQPKGFHDVNGSNKFFRINSDASSTTKQSISSARDRYNKFKNDKTRIFVNHSARVKIPSITYIVPCRVHETRNKKSIKTVVENIRAQRFPIIEIIVTEQDYKQKLSSDELYCTHFFIKSSNPSEHFIKSIAFNTGVSKASNNKIVLHDADILVPRNYTNKISHILKTHTGCHIGSRVLYFDPQSTGTIYNRCKVNPNARCNRVVAYFEGGSIACTKDAYVKAGAFNEDFIGYGMEDCDFFNRLKRKSQFFNNRTVDMYHLHHGRVPGWEDCHEVNKNKMVAINRQMTLDAYINMLRTRYKRKYK